MRRKKRYEFLVLILVLAIGFAAVSTNVIINGNSLFGTNTDDFDVIFTKSVIDGIDVSESTISEDGASLTFTTSELAIIGDTSVLDFEVTNNSTQYDASVQVECTSDGERANTYYKVESELPESIRAASKENGNITVTLLKTSVDEIEETFTCTINAIAQERTDIGIFDRNKIEAIATNANGENIPVQTYEITGSDKEFLLNALNKFSYIEENQTVSLIEIDSDSYDTISKVSFDFTSKSDIEDNIIFLHYNIETNEWQYLTTQQNINNKIELEVATYDNKTIAIEKNGYFYNIDYQVGELITIEEETFNVIRDNGDSITMFASQNLGTNYRQTSNINYMTFSDVAGWGLGEDIDIQLYDGNAKIYVNEYVSYLKTYTKDNNIHGTLITLKELKNLGCEFKIYGDSDDTCINSDYISWINNEQIYWVRTATKVDATIIWRVYFDGSVSGSYYTGGRAIRPVITISKETLKNL